MALRPRFPARPRQRAQSQGAQACGAYSCSRLQTPRCDLAELGLGTKAGHGAPGISFDVTQPVPWEDDAWYPLLRVLLRTPDRFTLSYPSPHSTAENLIKEQRIHVTGLRNRLKGRKLPELTQPFSGTPGGRGCGPGTRTPPRGLPGGVAGTGHVLTP